MRTKKSQQAQTQRQLVRAAVDLMSEHGFDGVTMKQVARAAGVGDATIYNYFPTKEKLVLGYFELALTDAITHMRAVPGWDDFTLQERLQLLVDNVLEQLLPDREFVAMAHTLVQRLPLAMLSHALPGRAALQAEIAAMLDAAEARQDIPACSFKPALSGLLADSVYSVVAYWLKDESDQFAQTTQLVDMGLGLVTQTLQSGLIDKLIEIGAFVLRSQMVRWMHNGPQLFNVLSTLRGGLGRKE